MLDPTEMVELRALLDALWDVPEFLETGGNAKELFLDSVRYNAHPDSYEMKYIMIDCGDWIIDQYEEAVSQLIGSKVIPDRTRKARYAEYLGSGLWNIQRNKIPRDKCSLCSSTERIEVHHNTYERVGGHEKKTDLTALCRNCHAKHHAVMP